MPFEFCVWLEESSKSVRHLWTKSPFLRMWNDLTVGREVSVSNVSEILCSSKGSAGVAEKSVMTWGHLSVKKVFRTRKRESSFCLSGA